MPLVTCIECGSAISQNAPRCVICGGYPKGVRCALCSETLAKSKAVGRIFDYDEGLLAVGYHPECLQQFELDLSKRIRVRCPDCGRYLDPLLEQQLFRVEDPDWDWETDRKHCAYQSDPACPFCGRPKVLTLLHSLCAKCKLPIYGLLHEYYGRYKYGLVSWTDKMAPVYGYQPTSYFHHPKCSLGISPPSSGERDYVFSPGNSTPVEVAGEQSTTPTSRTNGTGCSSMLITLMVIVIVLLLLVA
jgi:hypothetical protein